MDLDQAKRHLGIYGDEQDDRVDRLVKAAREMVEVHLDRSLIETAWQETFERFPPTGEFFLSRAPLLAVSSIQYVDENEATQTLASSEYEVDITGDPGRVVPTAKAVWPSVSGSHPNPVQVNYTAGYADVPAAIQQAILLVATQLDKIGQPFEKMDIMTSERAVNNLLASYVWGL